MSKVTLKVKPCLDLKSALKDLKTFSFQKNSAVLNACLFCTYLPSIPLAIEAFLHS